MYPAGDPTVRVRLVELSSGLRVRVLESGPADGPPVFLIHGWACSVYSFRKNVGALAAAGHRVLAADLKGHGLSDKPLGRGEYATEPMVAHVLEILDALGVARAALVGHSMGGALALDVAMRVPARVSRVALLDSVGLGVAPIIQVVRALTPGFVAPLLPPLVRRWTISLVLRLAYGRLGGFSSRDVDEYWAPTQFRETVLAARAMAHEFTWSPQPAERLGSLHMPTLVVFGTKDRLVTARSAERLVRALPEVRLELIDGAGHVVPEEAPDRVNALLLDFLAPERAALRPRESGAA
jgi:pimeloyl-ACP methyl ester carboxylesterase